MTEKAWEIIGIEVHEWLIQVWREEIERAVEQVKNPVERSGLDRWFRRRWYIAQAKRRKEVRRLREPEQGDVLNKKMWM